MEKERKSQLISAIQYVLKFEPDVLSKASFKDLFSLYFDGTIQVGRRISEMEVEIIRIRGFAQKSMDMGCLVTANDFFNKADGLCREIKGMREEVLKIIEERTNCGKL